MLKNQNGYSACRPQNAILHDYQKKEKQLNFTGMYVQSVVALQNIRTRSKINDRRGISAVQYNVFIHVLKLIR